MTDRFGLPGTLLLLLGVTLVGLTVWGKVSIKVGTIEFHLEQNKEAIRRAFLMFVISISSFSGTMLLEYKNLSDNAVKAINEDNATTPADQTSQPSAGVVPQTTDQEIAGASNPNDLNPVKAQTMIDDVTIGHEVVDGTIPNADQGDDFAPGQKIYITMKVADVPATSKIKVFWYGPGDTKISQEEKSVPQGAKYLSFSQTKTRSWAKGDYRAEVWIGDEKVNTQHFNVTDKSEAGN